MNDFELEIRAENGKVIGGILLRDGQIRVSEESGEDFRKATEYILTKKSVISYWDGEKTVYRRLQGGSLETIEALRDYLSHNFKFLVSLKKAVWQDQQLALFGQKDHPSVPSLLRKFKYLESRSPYPAVRRLFQERDRNGKGTIILIADLSNSDDKTHLAREAATHPALAA